MRNCCAQRQLEQLLTAADNPAATKIRHYVTDVRGGTLDATSLSTPAAYLTAVRKRCQREALAQWRTGSHWGAEETGRWLGLSREQRVCPHCSGGTETVEHMLFPCPLYAPLRMRFADLFESCTTTLFDFMQQPAVRLARFVSACHHAWLMGEQMPPHLLPEIDTTPDFISFSHSSRFPSPGCLHGICAGASLNGDVNRNSKRKSW